MNKDKSKLIKTLSIFCFSFLTIDVAILYIFSVFKILNTKNCVTFYCKKVYTNSSQVSLHLSNSWQLVKNATVSKIASFFSKQKIFSRCLVKYKFKFNCAFVFVFISNKKIKATETTAIKTQHTWLKKVKMFLFKKIAVFCRFHIWQVSLLLFTSFQGRLKNW